MRLFLLTLAVLSAYSVSPLGSLAGESGAGAEYVGGTADFSSSSSGALHVTGTEHLVFHTRKSEVRVPWDRINLLEYGQKVDRRYALSILVSPIFLLSKKRDHYLTIGYAGEAGKQQALVFKLKKDRVRSVLVSLEARTGLKVEFQDSEARKAGKG